MASGSFSLAQFCLLLGLPLVCLGQLYNCTGNKDGRTLACYTCMGRNLQSCTSGLVCCKGACFKLEDKKHNLIVKGCVVANEEDGSMKKRKLDVPLYWANNEHAEGESYFCKGSDFCNSVSQYQYISTLLFTTGSIVLSLLFS